MARGRPRAPTIEEAPVRIVGRRCDFLSLPRDVRSRLEEVEVPRLRRLRDAIATDANLPMPPIHVEPWGWTVPAAKGVVFGKASPVPVGDGFRWGTVLPAPTPLVTVSDELLRRILGHEFAHCFWWNARILRAMQEGRVAIHDHPDSSEAEAVTNALAEDREQLIDPSEWFGAWDTSHFIAEYGNPELDEPTRRFLEEWVGRGLPVRRTDLRFKPRSD
jgi:hypothetical protein